MINLEYERCNFDSYLQDEIWVKVNVIDKLLILIITISHYEGIAIRTVISRVIQAFSSNPRLENGEIAPGTDRIRSVDL